MVITSNNPFYKENTLLLIISGLFFGIIIFFYSDYIHEDVYGMIYISPIIVCVVLSFSMSIHYKKSRNVSLTYTFLGLAMLSLLIAEILWLVMPYLGINQYESYPDVFYLGYSVFAIVFPLFILRYFKICLTKIHYFLISAIVIGGGLIYTGISYDNIGSSSFGLGLVFVLLTGGIIGISVITMMSIKNTKMFRIWMLIVFSFLVSGIADIWYYASENSGNWEASSWVNAVWFVSYLIMIFAINEQRYCYVVQKSSAN